MRVYLKILILAVFVLLFQSCGEEKDEDALTSEDYRIAEAAVEGLIERTRKTDSVALKNGFINKISEINDIYLTRETNLEGAEESLEYLMRETPGGEKYLGWENQIKIDTVAVEDFLNRNVFVVEFDSSKFNINKKIRLLSVEEYLKKASSDSAMKSHRIGLISFARPGLSYLKDRAFIYAALYKPTGENFGFYGILMKKGDRWKLVNICGICIF